ncbi:AKAP7 2'5' RNA ligase-like domain-containing protein [Aspergillus pseudonomiae]|uniref:AKAP7 2'5' RNA ligase-like domain-containing protein n=1 Tax=Aspergillus pseudonomiae TaxID=1506151 RepID=A0A5N7D3S8_9EURO|nr:AKAP7 2'5' RNA ligase-like domain-containing protein [Aspergillus pseudonomiae]KAE8400468.1 AKAP7 2'5' RNA ligase-like domain-containing protein [Aspergillus pseudonomiae]
MIYPRPYRPLTTTTWPSTFIFFRSYHPKQWTTVMSDTKKKEKRPPLTHFLCLPLVNSKSLPQLESSLAAFKASIPRRALRYGAPGQPLIPDGALRPVGTLHLTLGVMSLPTKERLNEAIEFFQSLDLATLVREAEKIASARAQGRKRNAPLVSAAEQSSLSSAGEVAKSHDESPPSPFIVSLESLHALPRARAATVLHAAPVDPTARLYPFCVLLRDKFLEAGFLVGEQKKGKDNEQTNDKSTEGAAVEEPSRLEEMPANIAEEAALKSDKSISTEPVSKKSTASKPKIRPLLLHATVANTIYVRGRARGGGPHKGQSRKNQYTFDARDFLSHYRNYYVDGDRTTPRAMVVTTSGGSEQDQLSGEGLSDNETSGSESEGDKSLNNRRASSDDTGGSRQQYPFVWAKDFALETVCICEMGAKKLDPEADEDGMNARLREKYLPVVERSLEF